MPIYEYECKAGHQFEQIQSFSAPTFTNCPTCGKKAERLISLASFHLKGSGWYSKDVAAKGTSGKPSVKEEAAPVSTEKAVASTEKKETSAEKSTSDVPASSDKKESKPEAGGVVKKSASSSSASTRNANRPAPRAGASKKK